MEVKKIPSGLFKKKRISRSSANAKSKRQVSFICKKIIEAVKLVSNDLSFNEYDIFPTPSSRPGMDIQLSPKAQAVWPFAIECKNHSSISAINSWWKQACKYETTKLSPIVIFKYGNTSNEFSNYVAINSQHSFCSNVVINETNTPSRLLTWVQEHQKKRRNNVDPYIHKFDKTTLLYIIPFHDFIKRFTAK